VKFQKMYGVLSIFLGILLLVNNSMTLADDIGSAKKDLNRILNNYAIAYLFGNVEKYKELVHVDRFDIDSTGELSTNENFLNNVKRMANSEFVRYKKTSMQVSSC